MATSKPTTMNLAVSVSTSSSTVNSPIVSKSPRILKAPCRTDWSNTGKLDARDRNHDAASSSQGRQKDAFLDVSTGKLVAPGRRLATLSPHFIKLCAAHGESLLDRETKLWSQSDELNERPRCEDSDMRYIYGCHSSSCSSSWDGLHGKSTIYQESTVEIFETVISRD